MKLLILAGGQGTKIWPYSRGAKPKQFQPILGEKSLFQWQVETLTQRFSLEDIFVSTKASYIPFVREQAPQILAENIIREPEHKRNQGPGTLFAALYVYLRAPEEPFMVIQSDCLRTPAVKFLDVIEAFDRLVKQTHKLLTIAHRPTYPTTGCDYFQLGMQLPDAENMDVYSVEKFLGRSTDLEVLKDWTSTFDVAVHANHICWFYEDFLRACAQHKPNWAETAAKLKLALENGANEKEIDALYAEFEPGPIEDVVKFVFETDSLILVPPFKWTDIGTWGSMYEYFTKKAGENYKDGQILDLDTKASLVKADKDKLVVTLGVEDLVIVDTADVLFVCRKDQAAEVSRVLKILEEQGLEKYL